MKPQTRMVLRLLKERGSLTTLEAFDAGAGIRLPARIKELRKVYGDDAIPGESETTNGTRYTRYRWAGDRAIQLDLLAS